MGQPHVLFVVVFLNKERLVFDEVKLPAGWRAAAPPCYVHRASALPQSKLEAQEPTEQRQLPVLAMREPLLSQLSPLPEGTQ